MSAISLTTISEEAFKSRSVADKWEMMVDASGEDGPAPNEILVANYASCFIAALRVSAREHSTVDLGRIEIDVTATLDAENNLSEIAFDIRVASSLGEDAEEIVTGAEEICHIHAALRSELHADISLTDDAF